MVDLSNVQLLDPTHLCTVLVAVTQQNVMGNVACYALCITFQAVFGTNPNPEKAVPILWLHSTRCGIRMRTQNSGSCLSYYRVLGSNDCIYGPLCGLEDIKTARN